MTGTSTSGAEWQGGGEAKALGRIFGPAAVEDDKDEAPLNKMPPTAAVHQATQDEIDLATQTQITADALKDAQGVEHYRIRAGNELLKLQSIFCRVDIERDAVIKQMRDEGQAFTTISAVLGMSKETVRLRYIASKAKRPMGGKVLRGRFLTWAANKFDLKNGTIAHYLTIARDPNRAQRWINKHNAEGSAAGKIGRAIVAAQKKPGVPEPLRRCFQALPMPLREAWLVWAASLLIGSDNPESIARWFAKRFTS